MLKERGKHCGVHLLGPWEEAERDPVIIISKSLARCQHHCALAWNLVRGKSKAVVYGIRHGMLVAGKSEGSEELAYIHSFTYSSTHSFNMYLLRLSMLRALLGIEQ